MLGIMAASAAATAAPTMLKRGTNRRASPIFSKIVVIVFTRITFVCPAIVRRLLDETAPAFTRLPKQRIISAMLADVYPLENIPSIASLKTQKQKNIGKIKVNVHFVTNLVRFAS